jgi:hypothetical protein
LVKINMRSAIVQFPFQAIAPLLLHVTKVCTERASSFPNKTTQTDSKYSNQGEWDGVPHTSEVRYTDVLAHTPEGRKTTLKTYAETGVLNKMDI